MSDQDSQLMQATFAAGCFWGVEAAFRSLSGVQDAVCGYTGGKVDYPHYKLVCTGTTGHAEAVLVTYDPNVISYQDLLDAFFKMHNPTQVNRQGPDVGSQYRSAVFFHDNEQRQMAQATIERLNKTDFTDQPIATRLEPASTFYQAEDYHQRYFEKNGINHCSI